MAKQQSGPLGKRKRGDRQGVPRAEPPAYTAKPGNVIVLRQGDPRSARRDLPSVSKGKMPLASLSFSAQHAALNTLSGYTDYGPDPIRIRDSDPLSAVKYRTRTIGGRPVPRGTTFCLLANPSCAASVPKDSAATNFKHGALYAGPYDTGVTPETMAKQGIVDSTALPTITLEGSVAAPGTDTVLQLQPYIGEPHTGENDPCQFIGGTLSVVVSCSTFGSAEVLLTTPAMKTPSVNIDDNETIIYVDRKNQGDPSLPGGSRDTRRFQGNVWNLSKNTNLYNVAKTTMTPTRINSGETATFHIPLNTAQIQWAPNHKAGGLGPSPIDWTDDSTGDEATDGAIRLKNLMAFVQTFMFITNVSTSADALVMVDYEMGTLHGVSVTRASDHFKEQKPTIEAKGPVKAFQALHGMSKDNADVAKAVSVAKSVGKAYLEGESVIAAGLKAIVKEMPAGVDPEANLIDGVVGPGFVKKMVEGDKGVPGSTEVRYIMDKFKPA